MSIVSKKIRVIVQCYDEANGDVIDNEVVSDVTLKRAAKLGELGYSHVEQIELIQKIQDIRLKHQILLNNIAKYPNCGSHTKKDGRYRKHHLK